jgi:hypothetical protein
VQFTGLSLLQRISAIPILTPALEDRPSGIISDSPPALKHRRKALVLALLTVYKYDDKLNTVVSGKPDRACKREREDG